VENLRKLEEMELENTSLRQVNFMVHFLLLVGGDKWMPSYIVNFPEETSLII
jgi:hypothetical protein